MKRLAFVVLMMLVGCAAPKPIIVKPWPCQRYSEVPEVHAELLEMKHTQEAVLWKNGVPVYAKPGEDGLYLATRRWVAKADAKCVSDRALVGEAVEKADKEKPSFWERIFKTK